MDVPTTITRVMPGIVAVLYFTTGVAFLLKRDLPWAIVWGSYAMANVGLVLAEIWR